MTSDEVGGLHKVDPSSRKSISSTYNKLKCLFLEFRLLHLVNRYTENVVRMLDKNKKLPLSVNFECPSTDNFH